MSGLLLLSWWYGAGWSWLAERITAKYKFIDEALSIEVLVRTFFAPWKQIQSTTTLQNFIQTTVDNLISRVVGMTVRFIMLFTALILVILLSVFSVAAFIVWPLLPFMIFILPLLTVLGVSL